MAPRTVKRLFDLEIDEISLVDKPANQHGLVAIAKRAEDGMPIFDPDSGYEVDEDELEVGDIVYDDETDQLLEVVPDEDDDDGLYEDYGDYGQDAEGYYDNDLVGVGKARRIQQAVARGRDVAGQVAARRTGPPRAVNLRKPVQPMVPVEPPARQHRLADFGSTWGFEKPPGRLAGEPRKRRGMRRVAGWAGDRRVQAGAAGVGAVGVAGGGAYAYNRRGRTQKSLGGEVYAELAKALGDDERDEVIAKAMDYVQAAREEAAEAWEVAKALEEERDLEEYAEIAEEYGLPVEPYRLGAVLKRASEYLPPEDLAVLDRVLGSAGAAMYDEVGYGGGYGGSEVMDTVGTLALETVGKAAGELTAEQAVTALFEANPEAYDEYLAETR